MYIFTVLNEKMNDSLVEMKFVSDGERVDFAIARIDLETKGYIRYCKVLADYDGGTLMLFLYHSP